MKVGWQTIPMGQLCSIKSGKSDTKDAVEDGAYAFFDRSRTIKKSSRYLFDCEAMIIPGEGTEFLPKHFVGKFDLHQRAYALYEFSNQIDVKFLYYYLHHKSDYFPQVAVGATVKSLRLRHFEQLPVSLTSIPEQQRIVGILDAAFDGIATVKANAEQNLQNARALFESHLQSVFTQRGEGWAEKQLDEVVAADCSLSYGIVQPGEEYSDGLPIVRPTDLTTQVIRLDGLKRINPKLAEGYKRTTLQGGEMLLCVRGSTGVVSIASPELAGGNVTRGIVPIRFDGAKISQDFGYHLMSSGAFQEQIRKKTYGAALMQINIRDLRNIAVSFPSLKEQAEISAKLDALREETQRLESLYQRKLAALAELKKSLLHQAFSGQLIKDN